MMALNWKFLTPLALAVVVVTAVVQKLAESLGWPMTPSLLGANVLLALLTLAVLRSHARAMRQRAESQGEPQPGPIAGAVRGA
jgi:hypothetical protein